MLGNSDARIIFAYKYTHIILRFLIDNTNAKKLPQLVVVLIRDSFNFRREIVTFVKKSKQGNYT